jgi:hypothetical protein
LESRWYYVCDSVSLLNCSEPGGCVQPTLPNYSLDLLRIIREFRTSHGIFTNACARNRYNRYLAVAARVVRRSLKGDERLAAERRGDMELRFAKWEVCRPPAFGKDFLGHPTRCSQRSELLIDRGKGFWEREANCSRILQGGKQGENKSLAAANQAAMQKAAGSGQQQ